MRKKKLAAINNAKAHVSCFANAVLTFGRLQDVDELKVMDKLMQGAEKITEDNTKDIECMLLTNAKMLDCVFYDALRKLPGLNMMNQIEAILNIAFRAQNQSRKALIALAEIKNSRRTMQSISKLIMLIQRRLKNLKIVIRLQTNYWKIVTG